MTILNLQKILLEFGLKIFRRREFQGITKLKPLAAKKLLERCTKAGMFIRARRNLYIFPLARPNHWIISNKLYEPSYISYETALSYHGIIPEIVYSVTAATTRRPVEFTVQNIVYRYHHIQRETFAGYRAAPVEGESVALAASAEKALCDYLHLVFLKKKSLNERIRWKKINIMKLRLLAKLTKPASFKTWMEHVIRRRHS